MPGEIVQRTKERAAKIAARMAAEEETWEKQRAARKAARLQQHSEASPAAGPPKLTSAVARRTASAPNLHVGRVPLSVPPQKTAGHAVPTPTAAVTVTAAEPSLPPRTASAGARRPASAGGRSGSVPAVARMATAASSPQLAGTHGQVAAIVCAELAAVGSGAGVPVGNRPSSAPASAVKTRSSSTPSIRTATEYAVAGGTETRQSPAKMRPVSAPHSKPGGSGSVRLVSTPRSQSLTNCFAEHCASECSGRPRSAVSGRQGSQQHVRHAQGQGAPPRLTAATLLAHSLDKVLEPMPVPRQHIQPEMLQEDEEQGVEDTDGVTAALRSAPTASSRSAASSPAKIRPPSSAGRLEQQQQQKRQHKEPQNLQQPQQQRRPPLKPQLPTQENLPAADLRRSKIRLEMVPNTQAHVYMETNYARDYPRRKAEPAPVVQRTPIHHLPTAPVGGSCLGDFRRRQEAKWREHKEPAFTFAAQ